MPGDIHFVRYYRDYLLVHMFLHVGMWTDKDVIEKKIKLYISK